MTDGRWAFAEVDLGAIAHNVRLLRERVAPAAVWAVVKANGYGHGAVEVARAALDGGAEGLCVALVAEGVELRAAGLTDMPILVLSEQPVDQLPALLETRLTATVYSEVAVAALGVAAIAAGIDAAPVHVKVDTGMRRVGAAIADVPTVVEAVRAGAPTLELRGLFTHLACADEPEHPATALQLAQFDLLLDSLRSTGYRPPLVHAANSAGALAHPESRHDLVRAGIAMYGVTPGVGVADRCVDLRPALRLVGRVSWVKQVGAGVGVSYGWRHTTTRATSIATVPIGYADGLPRRLSGRGEVLIGGRRRPIVGAITMDQFMVDCGDDAVQVGDEVVLLGEQGDDRIRPEDWATLLGTIGYEVVCGISARVPRRYVGPGQ